MQCVGFQTRSRLPLIGEVSLRFLGPKTRKRKEGRKEEREGGREERREEGKAYENVEIFKREYHHHPAVSNDRSLPKSEES